MTNPEGMILPSFYFAHKSNVGSRDGMLLTHTPHITVGSGEKVDRLGIRFRTIGDVTRIGAVESSAADVETVIREIAGSRVTERGDDDKKTEAAIEDRKKEGSL